MFVTSCAILGLWTSKDSLESIQQYLSAVRDEYPLALQCQVWEFIPSRSWVKHMKAHGNIYTKMFFEALFMTVKPIQWWDMCPYYGNPYNGTLQNQLKEQHMLVYINISSVYW